MSTIAARLSTGLLVGALWLPAVGCLLLSPSDWEIWDQGIDTGPGFDSDTPHDTDPDTDTARDSDPDTQDPVETGDSQPQDTGDTAPPAELIVSSLDPVFGPRGGGSLVTLTGEGFTEATQVSFGGLAAELVSFTAGSLELRTPAAAAEGWVDVVVQRDEAEVSSEDAFRYLDLDDASGLAAAMGALQWFDYVGGYWSSDDEDYGLLQFWFPSAPQDTHYWSYFAPTLDSCASDYFEIETEGSLDLGGGAGALLAAPSGTSISPTWEAENTRFVAALDSSDFELEAEWDLTLSGLWDLPDFTITDMVETPPAFSLTSPVLDGGSPASLSPDGLQLRWTAAGADQVLVYIAHLDGSGATLRETVTCAAQDDGAFDVPADVWSGWLAGDVLWVFVGQLKQTGVTVPLSNGESRVAGIHWQVGGAVAR